MSPQSACIRGCKVTKITFIGLFSTVRFKMPPQITCLRECKFTLVAFVWLFPTVRFQMSPQMACTRGCIITLVALVWLFSTMGFQMSYQIACVVGCKVTLVTCVWLFTTVHFQMCFQIVRSRGCIITLVAFVSCQLIIQAIVALINIHHFIQVDASSFAASVQLTRKRESKKSKIMWNDPLSYFNIVFNQLDLKWHVLFKSWHFRYKNIARGTTDPEIDLD